MAHAQILAILCLAVVTAAQGAGPIQTFPAFVWGSGDYIAKSAEKHGIQASYEILPSSYLTDLLPETVCSDEENAAHRSLDCGALSADAQNLVTVFVQGNVVYGNLARGEASTLQQEIEAAPSSLYLSNVESQGLLLSNTLVQSIPRYGDCSAASAAVDQLTAQLKQTKGAASALICEAAGSQYLGSAVSQLKATGRPYLIVYAGKPEKIASRPVERTLISTSAGQQNSTYLCSQKCMAQVRLFEVLILIVLLLIALAVGLCMLHIIDTPSRFEAEKKENTRHQE